MFVRVRGKGASPENSQAAVMHLRGFRFSNSAAPDGAAALLPLASTWPHTTTASERTRSKEDALAASAAGGDNGVTVTPMLSRRFAFVHFPVGVQATTVVAQQRAYEAQLQPRSVQTATPRADCESAAPAAVQLPALSPAQRQQCWLVWKELWNMYDIVYDDVVLLPWSHAQASTLLRTLASPSSSSSPHVAPATSTTASSNSGDGTTTTADAAVRTSASTPYTRLSSLTGSRKAVVCTHYLAEQARLMQYTADKRSGRGSGSAAQHEARDLLPLCPAGPSVLVLDCSTLSAAEATGKLAVQLAWLAAYTTLLPDQPLVRAGAVLVCLPYDVVPSMASLQAMTVPADDSRPVASDAATTDAQRAAAAPVLLDAFDFLAQHVTLLHDTFASDMQAATTTTTRSDDDGTGKCSSGDDANAHRHRSLPIGFVGRAGANDGGGDDDGHNNNGSNAAADLASAVRACVRAQRAQTHALPLSSASLCSDEIVYVVGDNAAVADDGAAAAASAAATRTSTTEDDADVAVVPASLQHAADALHMRVRPLIVPLRALLDDDEEVWDVYTQRENARLNFCPCCSQCNHSHSHEGDDNKKSDKGQA